MEPDPETMALPSFFLAISELGPDVPEELKEALGDTREEMKFFCSAIRRVGRAAEPGFIVSFSSTFCNLDVVVAPGTKRGCNFRDRA